MTESNMSEKIAYEQHPVSPERKAELRSQGFTILDIRFKPEEEAPKPTPKPRAKAKVTAEEVDTF
jgi:hypothetical protein